jgi:hypothetical protein
MTPTVVVPQHSGQWAVQLASDGASTLAEPEEATLNCLIYETRH